MFSALLAVHHWQHLPVSKDINVIYFIKILRRVNELIHVEYLGYCLAHDKHLFTISKYKQFFVVMTLTLDSLQFLSLIMFVPYNLNIHYLFLTHNVSVKIPLLQKNLSTKCGKYCHLSKSLLALYSTLYIHAAKFV